MEGVVTDTNPAEQSNGKTEEMPPELMEKYHITANVSGNLQPVSLKELRDNVQKEMAGDARLRAAHDTEAALQTDVERGRALTAAVESNGDVEAWRRALQTAGMTDEQIAQAFAAPQAPVASSSQETSTGETRDVNTSDERFDDLSGTVEQLRGTVEQLIGIHNQARQDSSKRSEQSEITRALELDTELSKLLTGSDQSGRAFVLDTAYRAVEKAKKTLPWGPRAIQHGLDEAKKSLKGIGARGIGSEDNQQQPDQYPATDYVQPGLGATGHAVGRFHRTSAPDKPVDVRDENYAQNVFQRLAAGLRKTE